MASLQSELLQQKSEGKKLKEQIDKSRKLDQNDPKAGISPESAALEKSIRDNRQKVTAIDNDTRQELTNKDRALQKFEDIENQFSRQRLQADKQLKDQEQDRRVLQDKMNGLEQNLDQATLENLQLKALNFDLDYKIATYSVSVEQSQKKIKFFNEKQSKALKELDLVVSVQDKELRRLANEFELTKRDLEKTRKETFLKIEELKRLESGNTKIQNEKFELKLEDLEN